MHLIVLLKSGQNTRDVRKYIKEWNLSLICEGFEQKVKEMTERG